MESPDLIPLSHNWPISTPELITMARVGVYRGVVPLHKSIRAHNPPTDDGLQLRQTTWAEAMKE